MLEKTGENQPKELETKTENGIEYIYLNGEWKEKKLPHPKKATKEKDIPIKILIGDAVEITGKARLDTSKNGRKYYGYKLDDNQPVYGGGNIFIRV